MKHEEGSTKKKVVSEGVKPTGNAIKEMVDAKKSKGKGKGGGGKKRERKKTPTKAPNNYHKNPLS